MNKAKLLKHLVILMFFMFIANSLVMKFHWDYTIWWSDMPLHFFGGYWESLLFIWFFSIRNLPLLKDPLELTDPKLIYKTIFFVLLIGLLWEVFEFYTNNYIAQMSFNTLDTLSDVFFDLSGGAFAILYFFKNIMIQEENTVKYSND